MAGHPYVAKMPDGRQMAVELPEETAYLDPETNELILKGSALRFLDRVQTLLAPLPLVRMTPARHRLLREVLDLTQAELGAALGLPEATVAAWEAGSDAADASALARLEQMRAASAKRGWAVPALAN